MGRKNGGIAIECHRIRGKFKMIRFYQKASGKPIAKAKGMNKVVALATLNKLIAKKLYLQYLVIK